jgi:hypothetical protein
MMSGGSPPPRPAYELQRHDADIGDGCGPLEVENATAYSEYYDEEGYLDFRTAEEDNSTIGTAGHIHRNHSSAGSNAEGGGGSDATSLIHEMHLALLYLLSNPEEFAKAASSSSHANNADNLAQWNAEYNDNESLYTENEEYVYPSNPPHHPQLPRTNTAAAATASSTSSTSGINPSSSSNNNNNMPLPYAIFADDAEVVLPQAHTASQLFGIETVTGMELEAAAGVPAISSLFLRWLALMPDGDHLTLIDPPGLTVMKIAGGRYRVTAAHKVVWTWMNEFFGPEYNNNNHQRKRSSHPLKIGDLVSLNIVDVFETDNHGKLLSYCPTFDNRDVQITDRNLYKIRKNTARIVNAIKSVQQSAGYRNVVEISGAIAKTVKRTVDGAVSSYTTNVNTQKKLYQQQQPTTSHSATAVAAAENVSPTFDTADLERHEV